MAVLLLSVIFMFSLFGRRYPVINFQDFASVHQNDELNECHAQLREKASLRKTCMKSIDDDVIQFSMK